MPKRGPIARLAPGLAWPRRAAETPFRVSAPIRTVHLPQRVRPAGVRDRCLSDERIGVLASAMRAEEPNGESCAL
jgi:hypothetical protein